MKARLALAAALALAPDLAAGGAWTRPEGEAGLFLTLVYAQADNAFDAAYRPGVPADYRGAELQVYAEYGLIDGVTLIAQGGWLEADATLSGLDAAESGFLATGGGVRVHLLALEQVVLAVEASGFAGGESLGAPAPAFGTDGPEAEARLLAGLSSSVWGMPAFADVQIGYRARFGREGDELRLDLTGGIDVREDWQVVMQSLSTLTVTEGEGPYPEFFQSKAQVGLAYRLTRDVAVQLSVFTTVYGREVIREEGAALGLSWRFGI